MNKLPTKIVFRRKIWKNRQNEAHSAVCNKIADIFKFGKN